MTDREKLVQLLIEESLGYLEFELYDDLFFYELLKKFVNTLSIEETERILLKLINYAVLQEVGVPEGLVLD